MERSSGILRFGKFSLETRDRRLTSDGHEIYLRPKTYATLLYLVERPGHLVTKNELLDAVWKDVEVSENALTRCIKEARAALGDEVQNPHFIRTVPRLGYEFIAEVESLTEPTNVDQGKEEPEAFRMMGNGWDANGQPSEPATYGKSADTVAPQAPSLLHRPRSLRTAAIWIAAVVLVVVAASLGLNLRGLRDRVLGRADSAQIRSVAVLPLQNLTGDPKQEYFADGMTEELITELGKIGALRVISHTSVMRYKNTDEPLPQIAKELNVDAVVEGAVSRADNRVRITAQLIKGSTDRHLWAESYERDLRDALSLQDDVAHAIASQIKAQVAPRNQLRLASHRPVNPEAYLLYLQGRVLDSRGTEADNRAAVEVLKRAIAIDPQFASAYAALGRVYSDRLFFLDPKEEWEVKAETAVEKALSLDPNLAEAHVARAALLFTPANHWQFGESIQEFRRALALNPNLAEAHVMLGVVYLHIGLFDESLHELQIAGAISPTEPDVAWYTGLSLMFGGKFQEALPLLKAVPPNPLTKALQAYDLWQMGQKQEAWALVHELLKSDPQEKILGLASIHTLLLADAGRRRQAEKRIKEINIKQGETFRPYGHFHHIAGLVADCYAQLNKPEQAVTWLKETATTGLPCYPCFEHDHALDPIRQDPRFVVFMQKLKPQWEYYKSTYGSRATAHNRRAASLY